MIDKIKDVWSRLRVRWHVVIAALLVSLPSILDWLSVIDLRPILERFVSEGTAGFVVAALPFLLTFLKSAVHVEPTEDN